jgi:hypothetical protein
MESELPNETAKAHRSTRAPSHIIPARIKQKSSLIYGARLENKNKTKESEQNTHNPVIP